jgi:hypothetical protein
MGCVDDGGRRRMGFIEQLLPIVRKGNNQTRASDIDFANDLVKPGPCRGHVTLKPGKNLAPVCELAQIAD